MTKQRDFKALVRARMEKTGERYTTARAQLLAERGGPIPTHTGIGGAQMDLAAARNFCTRYGVSGPDGAPLTEAMAFGMAGGVGFLYGVFEYGGRPTMSLVCRNDSMPNGFIEPLFDRVGLDVEIHTTGSERKAATTLDAELDAGRSVLCTVGAGGLAYLGLPVDEAAAAPLVVGVVGVDGDDYLIDDRTPQPHRVDGQSLATARRLYGQSKHRLITSGGAVGQIDWDVALRRAVREGAEGYDRPPVPQFASNVGTRGLRKWADLLVQSGAKSWAKVFGSEWVAAFGLTRMVQGIDHQYTVAAASRPLYARFLRDAADVVGEATLVEAADLFEASGREWTAMVDVAAAAHPNIARYVELAQQRVAMIDEGPDPDEMRRLRDLQDACVDECDIDAEAAGAAFDQLHRRVTAIADIEEQAVAMLR